MIWVAAWFVLAIVVSLIAGQAISKINGEDDDQRNTMDR